MAEFERVADLLEGANRRLLEGIDFSRADSQATEKKVAFLTVAAEITHGFLLRKFGGQAGIRQPIDQAIAPAFQSLGGEAIYSDDFDIAAMLWRGITGGHTFVDGNKRTGFVVASYYLRLVGHPAPPSFDREDVKAFGWKIADGEIRDVETISGTLRSWWGQ